MTRRERLNDLLVSNHFRAVSKREHSYVEQACRTDLAQFQSDVGSAPSDEARRAVNAAFDAMATWRTETVDSFEEVIDKMAAAARKLGWPQQIVDATRAQMQDVIKMQIQTMDRLMDAWEEQIKSPSSSSTILSKLG